MSARLGLGLRGQDAWRRHPIFKWTWLDALPGIREGTGAFVLFVAADSAYSWLNAGKPHGAHGHAAASGDDHHVVASSDAKAHH